MPAPAAALAPRQLTPSGVWRLRLWMVAFTLLVLLYTAWATLQIERRTQAEVNGQLQANALLLAELMKKDFSRAQQYGDLLAKGLGAQPELLQPSPSALDLWLDAYDDLSPPRVLFTRILGAQGQVLASDEPGGVRHREPGAARAMVGLRNGQLEVGAMQHLEGSTLWHVPLRLPVRDAQGRLIGTIELIMDFSPQASMVEKLSQEQDKQWPGFAAGWIRNDGVMLLRCPLVAEARQPGDYSKPRQGVLARTLRQEPAAQQGFVRGLVSADKMLRNLAWHRVGAFGITAFVTIPQRDLWIALWRNTRLQWFAALAMLVLAWSVFFQAASMMRALRVRSVWDRTYSAVVRAGLKSESLQDLPRLLCASLLEHGLCSSAWLLRVDEVGDMAVLAHAGPPRLAALPLPCLPLALHSRQQEVLALGATPEEGLALPVSMQQTPWAVLVLQGVPRLGRGSERQRATQRGAWRLRQQIELVLDNLRLRETLANERDSQRHRALHDMLTGLPNRAALTEFLSGWARPGTSGRYALALVDLDDFKQVNDRFGHQAGDVFLREVAQRMRHALRPEDYLVRLGGDEFVIAFAPVRESADIDPALRRLIDQVQRPLQLAGSGVVTPGLSLGIVWLGATPQSMEALLMLADRALYRSKRNKATRKFAWTMFGADIPSHACDDALDLPLALQATEAPAAMDDADAVPTRPLGQT
ncbi:putative Diguanylate cyclase [Thiomonas sp. X19]|nr:putative Diguanylate cyclase [Thiomonas sp. X19]